MDKEAKELLDKYMAKFRANKYSKQLGTDVLYVCACTDNWIETFKYAIKLCDKKLSEEDYFTEMMIYAGFEDPNDTGEGDEE